MGLVDNGVMEDYCSPDSNDNGVLTEEYMVRVLENKIREEQGVIPRALPKPVQGSEAASETGQ